MQKTIKTYPLIENMIQGMVLGAQWAKASVFIADRVLPRTRVRTAKFTFAQSTDSGSLALSEQQVMTYAFDDVLVAGYSEEPNPKRQVLSGWHEMIEQAITVIFQDRERRVAAVIMNPKNYHRHQVIDVDQSWLCPESDPLGQLKAAIERPSSRPDTLVVGADVWKALTRNPNVRAQSLTTRQSIARKLQLTQILVGKAKHINRVTKPNGRGIWQGCCALIKISKTEPEYKNFGFTAEFQCKSGTVLNLDQDSLHFRVSESVAEVVANRCAGVLLRDPLGV